MALSYHYNLKAWFFQERAWLPGGIASAERAVLISPGVLAEFSEAMI